MTEWLGDRSRQLIREASRTEFWKLIFLPQFNRRLETLDSLIKTTKDPWQRYGYAEAYNQMSEFKLYFDDHLKQGDQAERLDELMSGHSDKDTAEGG